MTFGVRSMDMISDSDSDSLVDGSDFLTPSRSKGFFKVKLTDGVTVYYRFESQFDFLMWCCLLILRVLMLREAYPFYFIATFLCLIFGKNLGMTYFSIVLLPFFLKGAYLDFL